MNAGTLLLSASVIFVALAGATTPIDAAEPGRANPPPVVATELSITQLSINRAKHVIDRAVVAYGGAERLAELTTLTQTFTSSFNAVGQSLRPGPPWDKNASNGLRAINLTDRLFVSREYDAEKSYDYDVARITRQDGTGDQLDYRAQTKTGLTDQNWDRNTGPNIRVTPVLLVKQLQERANTSHHLGQVVLNNQQHDVISLVMATGPALSLYFGRKTGLLSHSERILPGAGLVEYRFLDYQKESGIPFNQRFQLIVDGELNEERLNTSTLVNADITAHTTPDQSLIEVGIAPSDEFGVTRLAPGVYLSGGDGTYGLFVELDDEIIAIGGTGGIATRLQRMQADLPNKPVTYGVMTHHHSDHIVGARTYAEQAITVAGSTAHEGAIKAVMGDAPARFEGIGARRSFKGKDRVLEIIDIGPTSHSENLLIAWLPKERILFQADHFNVPAKGPVAPANSNTQSFAKALKRNGLKPVKIASAHSRETGTMKDLRKALRTKPSLKHRVKSPH